MTMRLLHRTSLVLLALLSCGLGSAFAQTPPTTGGRQLRMFSRTEMWRPTDLSTALILWLDASDSSSLTLSGTSVSQWNDKSGNSRHISQATPAARPAFRNSDRRSVEFDGVDDILENNVSWGALNTTQKHIFTVLRWSVVAGEDLPISIGNLRANGQSAGTMRALYSVAGIPSRPEVFGGGFSPSFNAADGSWTQMYAGFGASGVNTYFAGRDGSYQTGSGTATPGNIAAGTIFGGWQIAASYFSAFNVSEVVVVDGVITTATRQNIEGYLAWKWGLQANLAAGHPYRFTPPTTTTALANTSLTLEIPSNSTSYSLNFTSAQPTLNAVSYQESSNSATALLRWTNGSVTDNDVFRMSDNIPPSPGWYSRNLNFWRTSGGNGGASYVSSGSLGAAPDGGSAWLGTFDANNLNIVTSNVQRAVISSDGFLSLGSTAFINPDIAGTSLVSLTSSGSFPASVANVVLRSPNLATMNTFPHSVGTLNPDSNTVIGAQTITSTTYPLRSLGNTVLGARALQTGLFGGRGGATLPISTRWFTGVDNTLVGNSVVTVMASGGFATYIGASAGQSSAYAVGDVAIGNLAASSYNVSTANAQSGGVAGAGNPNVFAPVTAVGSGALRGFTDISRPHHVVFGADALSRTVTWNSAREVIAIGNSAGSNIAAPSSSTFYLSNRAVGDFLLIGGLEYPRLQVNAPADPYNLTTGARNPNTVDGILLVNAVANVDNSESLDPTNDPRDEVPTLSTTTPTVLSPTNADPGLRLTVQEPLPSRADMTDAVLNGIATATFGTNTLTDATKAWTPGQWVGYRVIATSDGGVNVQQREISANTATQLTVTPNWTTVFTTAGAGVRYSILPSIMDTERSGAGSASMTQTMTQIDFNGNVHMRPYGTATGATEAFGEVAEMRFYDRANFTGGTVTTFQAIGTSGFTDNVKSWFPNAYLNAVIRIVGGPGEGQIRRIVAHGTSSGTVNAAWTTALVAGQSRYEIEIVAETGIATSASAVNAITLTDASKDWVSENLNFAGAELRIVGGAGRGQIRTVVSNTASVVTVNSGWSTALDGTTIYQISSYFPRYVGFRPANNLTQYSGVAFNPFMKLPPPPGAGRLVLQVASTDGGGALAWSTNVGLMAFDQTWDNRAAEIGTTIEETPMYGWPTTGYAFGSTGAAEQSMIFGTKLNLAGPPTDPLSSLAPKADYITGFGYGLMTGLDDVADAGNNSVGLGHNSMRSLTTGTDNVALGKMALNSVNTGSQNLGIGYGSLAAITTGTGFVAIGASALANATAVVPSTAIGHSALLSLTTGVRNVAVGEGALRLATTATDVVAIGTSAASSMLAGQRSVIAGSNAAMLMTSGAEVVLIGANIAPNLVEAQRVIAIGSFALDNAVNVNDQIAIGDGALRSLTTSANGFNIAIGQSAMGNSTNTSNNVAIGRQALLTVGSGVNNVAIGAQALVSNTSGSRNVAIGNSAGSNLLSGDDNYLIGTSAGSSITVGSRNFAIGFNALSALVTESDNIAIGSNALSSLTTGANNVVMGTDAARSLVNGQFNVLIGPDVVRQMTVGQSNVFVGSSAGRQMASGDENVAVGSEAMRLSPGTNRNLALGSRALLRAGAGEQNIAIGTDALTFNTTGARNIVVGTSAGFAMASGDDNAIIGQQAVPLSFSGSRNMIIGALAAPALRSGDENIAVGQSVVTVMTSGSSHIAIGDRALSALVNGNANTGMIVVGNSAGSTLASGSNNIGVGAATLGTGGSDNIAIGLDAMRSSTTPQTNIALGVRAMRTITTGTLNIAAGIDAMNGGLTTGNQNVAIGSSAGTLLTSGTDNVAIGDQAMNGATTASSNIAIGQQAAPVLSLSDNNIAVGQFAMLAATSGGSMIAIGQRALGALVTGTAATSHIAIGASAGSAFTAGTRDIAIGHLAYSSAGGGTNVIAIGFEAMRSATNASRNVALGQNALRNVSSGDNNTAIGSNAILGSAAITGTANVAIGTSAGAALQLGAASNTLIGSNSGTAITTGFSNTAIGSNTMRVTTGNSNVAIGSNAMSSASGTTATNNTVVGHRAATGLTTGAENVVIGHTAMGTASIASSNVALGQWSLAALTTGGSNVAIGTSAGRAITTASNNIAIGENSLRGAITTGASNIMIGYSAGSALATTASQNIGIGSNVMQSLTSGTNVIAMGFEALRNTTTLSAPFIAIGNGTMFGVVSSTNTSIAIGNQALAALTSSPENIGIGDGALFTLSTGLGSNIAIGHFAMRSGLDASSSIAIGREALVNARGSGNIALGFGALQATNLTSAADNVAIGTNALYSATNPRLNIAAGDLAAYSLIDGIGNVAIGSNALYNSTNGANNNVAIGMTALNANTTGSDNVAIGFRAVASSTPGVAATNVAVGAQALEAMVNGSNNTVVGDMALSQATNDVGTSGGLGNVALGNRAGRRVTVPVSDRLFVANSETKSLLYGELSNGRLATNVSMPVDGTLPVLNAAMQVNSTDPAAPGAVVRLAADPIESAMVVENASGTMLFEINSAGEIAKTANANYTWPDGPPPAYAAGVAMGKGIMTSSSVPSPALSWTQMTSSVLVENVNFPDVPANTSQDIVIGTAVPGAAVGDVVGLGVPAACGLLPLVTFHAWVSDVDQVTIRINNLSAADLNPPDDQNFRILVIK